MADMIIANPGLAQSDTGKDRLGMFLKMFTGEVLTAFSQATITGGRFTERTIKHGKSAIFPIVGRAKAKYLKAGKSLDDLRTPIEHNERTIVLDGLLTADTMIFDLDDAMNHYEVRGIYSKELGEALAVAQDCAVLAEVAKMVVKQEENIKDNAETGVKGTGKGLIVTEAVAEADYGETEALGMAIFKELLTIKTHMSENNVPRTQRNCYIKPMALNALIAHKDIINKLYGATMTIEEDKPAKLLGFDLIEAPMLTQGGTDNENVIQGDGHEFPSTYKDTCQFLVAHPYSAGILTLKGLGTEHARRPEYQADQFIFKYAKGFGGLRPEAAYMGVITKA
nr:MAG TPA: major capsid protein [Bacteriophage sp.]